MFCWVFLVGVFLCFLCLRGWIPCPDGTVCISSGSVFVFKGKQHTVDTWKRVAFHKTSHYFWRLEELPSPSFWGIFSSRDSTIWYGGIKVWWSGGWRFQFQVLSFVPWGWKRPGLLNPVSVALEQQVKAPQEKWGQARVIAWQADPKLDFNPKQSPVLVFDPASHWWAMKGDSEIGNFSIKWTFVRIKHFKDFFYLIFLR